MAAAAIPEYSHEPILEPNPDRFSLFPIEYHGIWDFYKRSICSFWTVEEVDLSKDVIDWKMSLNEIEREMLLNVMSFFASGDGIVGENLVECFSQEVQIPEARAFYSFQAMMETVHAEMYALIIDTLVRDSSKKRNLFRAIHTMPHVRAKAEWSKTWINGSLPFANRLVAFACIEGIFFSGSFAAIFWLKKRGLMPGLTFSNELISRDEGSHVQFACLLFSILRRKPDANEVVEIVKSAVEVEKMFWDVTLKDGIVGFTVGQMHQYIEYVADHLLIDFNLEPHFMTPNPFDFMENISLEGKSNFFERRVGEYRSKFQSAVPEWERFEFRTDVDF